MSQPTAIRTLFVNGAAVVMESPDSTSVRSHDAQDFGVEPILSGIPSDEDEIVSLRIGRSEASQVIRVLILYFVSI